MTTSVFYVGQRLIDPGGVDVQVERVARGGFGEVAMGPSQMSNGVWLALKGLRPDLLARLDASGGTDHTATEALLRAAFLKEALTWVGLWPHPNLLQALFVSRIDGQIMLVLTYAEQGSLRDLFDDLAARDKWLMLDYALHLAQQIAAGLMTLHTPRPDLLRPFPIVHRDLKPENILLNQYDYALITDFGLAKAVTDVIAPTVVQGIAGGIEQAGQVPHPTTPIVPTHTQVYQTQRGARLGTPAYMAPEQWLDAAQAGPAADAYAFGLIIAELLTGQHPLLSLDQPHTLADWQQAHLAGRPISLRQLGNYLFAAQLRGLPVESEARQEAALEQVEALVARLLAKLPAARPSLDETLRVLQAAAWTLGERPPYTPPDEELFYAPTVEHQLRFWQVWANAYNQFGLHAEALPRIERALALAPQDPNALTIYASILSGLGRRKEAMAVDLQALAMLPEEDLQRRAIRWNNIGGQLSELERYAEAETAYAEATRLVPTYANAWFNRANSAGRWAEVEQTAGQREAAQAHVAAGLAHITVGLQLNPNNSDYRKVEQALLLQREQLHGQE